MKRLQYIYSICKTQMKVLKRIFCTVHLTYAKKSIKATAYTECSLQTAETDLFGDGQNDVLSLPHI